MNDEEFNKVKDYAFKLMSFRPRSIQEIKQKLNIYLSKKNLPENLNAKVISYLEEHSFLSDIEFAKWWVSARQRNSIKGIKVIRLELLSKGINKDIIDEILNSVEGNIELEKAKEIIVKKLPQFRKFNSKKLLKLKFGKLLFSRGFTGDIIKKAIDESIQKI